LGQGEQPDHPDSVRIAFSVDELKRDLLTMLETEGLSALNTAASDTLEQVGFRDPWKLPAQDTLDFIARRQNLLSNVPQEIFDSIREEISAGLNKGESIRDLSKRITKAFDEIGKERAQVIAQTETAAAYGFASDKAARAAGITYKKWIHSVISKVPRPDHLAIDGLIIPFDEAYPVGNPPLMYPHAPDGAAEDVINCRCMSIPVTEDEYKAR
jgi:SPP1 gp7 family putative phage head morphogenesis protein